MKRICNLVKSILLFQLLLFGAVNCMKKKLEKQLVISSSCGENFLWSIGSTFGKKCGTLPKGPVAFDPNNNVIAVGCQDKTVKLFEIKDAKKFDLVKDKIYLNNKMSKCRVRSVLFSSDGEKLAAAYSEDSSSGHIAVLVWNVDTQEIIAFFPFNKRDEGQRVPYISFTPCNKKIFIFSPHKYRFRECNIENGRIEREFNCPRGSFSGDAKGCAFSGDGKKFVYSYGVGGFLSRYKSVFICILHLVSGANPYQDLEKVDIGQEPVGVLALNQDATVAACSFMDVVDLKDNRMQLFDLISGQPKGFTSEDRHKNPVSSLAFSKDGGLLVSGSCGGFLKVWDVNSGDCLLTTKGHSQPINGILFCPLNSIYKLCKKLLQQREEKKYVNVKIKCV